MAEAEPVLSPCHLGEALVKELAKAANLAELRGHDPKNPSVEIALGSLFDFSRAPSRVEANSPLENEPGSPRFDGMHDIDCAVVFEKTVIPIELKLGETRLSPRSFAERFVSKSPRLTHKNMRIAGSMVALLDWNQRAPLGGQPAISLRACGLPVQPRWLLMVREVTWQTWAKKKTELSGALGTVQLAAVLTLEELARHVGVEHARRVALGLAKESIGSWFPGSSAQGGKSHGEG